MAFSHSLRRRIRRVSVSFLGVSATFYFVFHVFHGERSLMAWAQLRQQVVEVQGTAEAVAAERHYLENKVRLLHPESLDPDMLDERARVMLNFGHPDEIVILDARPAGRQSPEGSAQ